MVVNAKARVEVIADTSRFTRKIEGEVKGINAAIGGIGAIVSAVFANQFVQSIGACIGKAIELRSAMRAVEQSLIHTGEIGKTNLAALREEFEKTAVATAAEGGPAAVAEDYRRMMTGVYSAAEAQRELGAIAKANATWQGRYGDSVEYSNKMLAAFDLPASRTTDLLEKSAVAADRGQTNFDELARAAGRYAPVLKSNNVELEEYLALASVMTAEGESGRALMAGFGDVLRELRPAMEQAGMGYTSLTDALRQLKARKMTAAEWGEFAPDPQMRANLQMLVENYDAIEAEMVAMEGAAGNLNREFEALSKSPAFKARQGREAWEEFKATVGEGFLGAIGDVANAFSKDVPDAIDITKRKFDLLDLTIIGIVRSMAGAVTNARALARQLGLVPELEDTFTQTETTHAARLVAGAKEGLYTEKQIRNYLEAQGRSPEEIEYALSQVKVKGEVLGAETPRKKTISEGAPKTLSDEEKAAARLGMTVEQYRAFKSGPLVMEETKAIRGFIPIETQKELAAAKEAREKRVAREEANAAAVLRMAELFGSAAADSLWDNGVDVVEQLGKTLATRAVTSLATYAAKAALSAIPGVGPLLAMFMGEGGGIGPHGTFGPGGKRIIRAASGTTLLPATPGGVWINAAERGQDETWAIIPPGSAGRNLIQRDLLPTFFPELTNVNHFTPHISATIQMRNDDPHHIQASVRAERGAVSRAVIQRKASD